jgi:hypothetical protein
MNFLSSKHFLEFLNNRGWLSNLNYCWPMPLTSGAKNMSPATRAWPSQNIWLSQRWRHRPRSSQITLQFDYSMRIRTCGGVESNQEIKTSMRVPTPLGFGPHNLTGGELTRRRNMAHGASSVQEARMILEGSWRSDCSPSSSCSGWSRGWGSGASAQCNSLMNSGERERRIPSDWAHSGSIPSTWMPNSSIRSSGDSRRGFGRPLATARNSAEARVFVTCKNSREREENGGLGFTLGGGGYLYPRRVGGLHPGRREGGGESSASQSSTELLLSRGRWRLQTVFGLDCGAGCWAGLMGYGGWAAARFLPPIFFRFPFSIFYFYSGLNILSSIWILFL